MCLCAHVFFVCMHVMKVYLMPTLKMCFLGPMYVYVKCFEPGL